MQTRFFNEGEIVTVIGDVNRPTQEAAVLSAFEDPETGEQGVYVHLLEEDQVDLVGPELIVTAEEARATNPAWDYLYRSDFQDMLTQHGTLDVSFIEGEYNFNKREFDKLKRRRDSKDKARLIKGLYDTNNVYINDLYNLRKAMPELEESVGYWIRQFEGLQQEMSVAMRKARAGARSKNPEDYLEESEYWQATGHRGAEPHYTTSDFRRAIDKGMIPPATMRAVCQTRDLPDFYREQRGWEAPPISERTDFRPQSIRFRIEDWTEPGESLAKTLQRIRRWATKHWPKAWGKVLISKENLKPTKTKRAAFYTFSQYDTDKYFDKSTIRTKPNWAPHVSEGREVQLIWGIPKRELPFEPDPTVFERTRNPYGYSKKKAWYLR